MTRRRAKAGCAALALLAVWGCGRVGGPIRARQPAAPAAATGTGGGAAPAPAAEPAPEDSEEERQKE
jgi:hypothetical protein